MDGLGRILIFLTGRLTIVYLPPSRLYTTYLLYTLLYFSVSILRLLLLLIPIPRLCRDEVH